MRIRYISIIQFLRRALACSIASVLLICLSFSVSAQSKEGKMKVRLKRDYTESELRSLQGQMQIPAKAALYGVVFPGGGQIYNKKYWKVPILYTGLAFFGYLTSRFHEDYTETVNNLAYASDDNYTIETHPLIDDRFRNFEEQNFIDRRDRFRRERDYYTILTILFYCVGIADAAVDAHLREFNVSEDLSMKIEPEVMPVFALGEEPSLSAGVKVSLRLK